MKYSCAVVVPSFMETEPERTLASILDCNPPIENTLIVFVFNRSVNCSSEIEELTNEGIKKCTDLFEQANVKNYFTFIALNKSFNVKDAGVGLARKEGMDFAYGLLNENESTDAPIICLDADCVVDKGYLVAVCKAFMSNLCANAGSVYFEHKLDKNESSAIVEYELYLRYYIEALRYCGYSFAFHTIGSSMAVRASVYLKCGGMNKRKAGEDFYFLHKIMPLGNFIEINDTIVFPLGRKSERVPFGTGKAMVLWDENQYIHWPAYHPSIFKAIKPFFNQIISGLYYQVGSFELLNGELHPLLREYLEIINFEKMVDESKKNTSNLKSFTKRLWGLLNGLVMLKCVHFLRDKEMGNLFVSDAVSQLLKIHGSEMEQLLMLRKKQRNYSNLIGVST